MENFFIQEIDNVIDEKLQNAILDFIETFNLPWYLGHVIDPRAIEGEDERYLILEGYNPRQLVHNVVADSKINSEFYDLIKDIIANAVNDHIKKNVEVTRAKFNLLMKDSDNTVHYPHVDISNTDTKEFISLIYYVKDSDGDTVFFDERVPKTKEKVSIIKRVTPKKGKAVLFDSRIFHASTSPIESDCRIVLNVVFRVLEE